MAGNLAIRGVRGLLAVLCIVPSLAFGQQNDTALFDGVDRIRAAAEAADATLLSPGAYARALADYDDARRDVDKGRTGDRILRRISAAEARFAEALENAELAALTLRDEIESRAAAISADARRLVPREMADAEKLFAAAAASLEKGKLKNARQAGERANAALRRAELNAIRARHLGAARSRLAEADAAGAARWAPQTLAKAGELLARADALLVADRYATAPAIALAGRAEYEARHAMYVGKLVERVRRGELTTEDIVADWESAMLAITAALDFEPDLSAGPAATRDAIISYARELAELREIVTQQSIQISGLEEEMRELDARLGGASADRAALIRQVERQARIREQFDQVRETFGPDEAIVLRDGDRLIIRLVGLGFASNSATPGPSLAPLMTKVDAAVGVFPQCRLTIEGHTDSRGRVSRNQALSEQRARAVMDYMTETLRIPAFRISAVGYGDSRPISSNRTDEGRAQNRRIDLIITPDPGSL
ncbi:MAG: OmpA family protein [Gammaproteobacteria bacterium]